MSETNYEIAVITNTATNTSLLNGTTGYVDNSFTIFDSTNHYCWGGCNHTFWNYPYTYPTTVYMYELKCPRCKTRNWGQLNNVVACKKCTAKLKAVSQEVDYEIPVGV